MVYLGTFKENSSGGVSSLLSARDLNRAKCLSVNEVAALAILSYIILGLCVFVYGQNMEPVDSVYLSIQTLLTIGYGDIPTNDRPFQSFYVLYGAGLCLAFFSILTSNIMEKAEAFERERVAKVTAAIYRKVFGADSGNGDAVEDSTLKLKRNVAVNPLHHHHKALRNDENNNEDEDEEGGIESSDTETFSAVDAHAVSLKTVEDELHVLKHQALIHVLHIVLVLLIGAAIQARIEGWAYPDALYWAASTITSVGYGDISPATSSGKVFFILYAPLGCAIVAKGFADLVRFPMLLRQKASEAKVMQQFALGLSERVLLSIMNNKSLSLIPHLQKDSNNLEKSEFVLMLLLIMDKVALHDLLLASSIFSKLDIHKEGSLSFTSLEAELKRARAREREEADREKELEEQRIQSGGISMTRGFESVLLGGGQLFESGLGGLVSITNRGVGIVGGALGGAGATGVAREGQ